MKTNKTIRLYDDGCLLLVIIFIIIFIIQFIIFVFSEYTIYSCVGVVLLICAIGLILRKYSIEQQKVKDIYTRHPEALRAFIYHRHNMFEKMWLKDNLDRFSYNKEQRKAILSIPEETWIKWEQYNKEILKIAKDFPIELRDFVNERHLYASYDVAKDEITTFHIKRLSLDWSQQIIDVKDSFYEKRRKINEILSLYPAGVDTYRARHPFIRKDEELVKHIEEIKKLQNLSNEAQSYNDWEEHQSSFENESYFIAKDNLPNHGRYFYYANFIKKDKLGNTLEGTYKIWQFFLKSYSTDDSLDYTYSPEYTKFNSTIKEFSTYNRYYLDHIYTNILNFILEVTKRYNDVVVLFVNHNFYNWDKDIFEYHYIKLKSRLWEKGIRYCDAEKITEKAPYYVVVDFVTQNKDLIKTCSDILLNSKETRPCILYYSFIKNYDRQEMEEILNQERKDKGIPEIIHSDETCFDSDQQKIINIKEGKHLVLASPGCGKTTILAERVRLALSNGINPDSMLCLTFTNRASRNMLETIEKSIDTSKDVKNRLFIGNIHKFAANYLYDNNIISQTSSILDETYVQNIILKLIGQEESEILLDYSQREDLAVYTKIQHYIQQIRYNHNYNIILNDTIVYQNSIEFSEQLRNQLCDYYNVYSIVDIYDDIEKLYNQSVPYQFEKLMYRILIAHRYESYKSVNNLVDFDDLLILSYNALKQHKKTFSWIQIDEVQDLNRLQLAIVDELIDNESNSVVVYLGDEQQAIFSFIGAKIKTIEYVKEICGNHIHKLSHNHRSPKYLLDVFNTYAERVLGVNKDILPSATKAIAKKAKDLRLVSSYSNETEVDDIIELVKDSVLNYPDQRIAVIVPNNECADEISNRLGLSSIDHFKISGNDVFCHQTIKTILAHLNVLYKEHNFISWSYLLKNLNICDDYSGAREFLTNLRESYLSPVDLLNYDEDSYMHKFTEAYSKELIIFDTETTGLNVYNDDIVQIAAVKLVNGKQVSSLNIVLETTKVIPEYLGTKKNPLIELYNKTDHFERSEGLRIFLDFVGSTPVLAHNAEYDYHILYFNLQKYCNINLSKRWNLYFDSLKIIKLIEPNLHSYRLENLLISLKLEGNNSHLADDDIMATLSLVQYCYNKAMLKIDVQVKFMKQYHDLAIKFSNAYKNIYYSALSQLYSIDQEGSLNLYNEFSKMYIYLTQNMGLPKIDKIDFVNDFIQQKFSANNMTLTLYDQLDKYLMELNSYREADLCDESNISNTNKVFVSTVHKAKGLEFETVIVMSVNDDVYPYWPNTQKSDAQDLIDEDARKLYVAITRAKERLYLVYYGQKTIYSKKWGKYYTHDGKLSRFISSISIYFN